MNGHICPECGTDRGAASDDVGRPGCRCAERAAEAVRAERSAEIAAAEDFDPLRIRPYVTLQVPKTGDGAAPSYAERGGDAAVTMPLGVLNGPGGGSGARGGPGDDAADATAAMGAVGAVPSSGSPPGAGPGYESGFGEEPSAPRRRQRKGPVLWLAVGASAVAVVGTAAFAGGLFSGGDEQERALPDTVTSAPSASDGPEPSVSASESSVGSQSPTPSASASVSASASASAPADTSASASVPPPRSATASPSATPGSSKPVAPTASATPSTARAADTAEKPSEPAAATLSRGDRGPEVVELQDRLAQLSLYNGPDNGHFNDRVEQAVRTYQSHKYIQGDPEGVYGPHTRRALEAETKEP